MTTITTRYEARGASAAREDIRNGNVCRVEDIDEGAVLAHLGLDGRGADARAILRDAASRAARDGYPSDGAELLEAARAGALRGYRDAMAAAPLPTVVIHGSALTSPDSARDVDIIFVGDRRVALRQAAAWAASRGLSRLPIDAHEARSGVICVPGVPEEFPPWERICGDADVEIATCYGVASHLRRHIAAAEIHAAITSDRVRFTLEDRASCASEDAEWAGYVDGRVALASAIRHAQKNGVWRELLRIDGALYGALAVVAEHGVGRIDAATLDRVRRGSPGPFAGLDAIVVDDALWICATHASPGDPCWFSWEALVASIVDGAPAGTVPPVTFGRRVTPMA